MTRPEIKTVILSYLICREPSGNSGRKTQKLLELRVDERLHKESLRRDQAASEFDQRPEFATHHERDQT